MPIAGRSKSNEVVILELAFLHRSVGADKFSVPVSEVVLVHTDIVVTVLVAHTAITVQLATRKVALLYLIILRDESDNALLFRRPFSELAYRRVRVLSDFLDFNVT